ncbi:hypothetical protein [Companilactobacillus sp.]|jgi:drug/metabolite transporter (DMT)-like permease|uniref:hypothetical protein n=1 Tax=Companilactobacillus sp. TaxID=2767905 RepID=UPI0025B7E1A2|nr:hypothetical protein [Companilactobacillus sp.]MCH4009584.1 hypothetical protein [Companilactobacillus sp.]MCH4052740.1 hypothetical protein [Companilactobacillus sp.]MCH4077526.1 hypothetical protein [Companilactobacillus sp.]MCH4126102.1 hypothetical protein [Companilactobacillus sp.]MCI1311810.1 hypothetical protein [Companilactobacillus sp.]
MVIALIVISIFWALFTIIIRRTGRKNSKLYFKIQLVFLILFTIAGISLINDLSFDTGTADPTEQTTKKHQESNIISNRFYEVINIEES